MRMPYTDGAARCGIRIPDLWQLADRGDYDALGSRVVVLYNWDINVVHP